MSLPCFHILGLSSTDAFEPVMNIEHETITGGFKCLYWLLKHKIALSVSSLGLHSTKLHFCWSILIANGCTCDRPQKKPDSLYAD